MQIQKANESGLLKNGWHARLARAFWPKKCTGETPIQPPLPRHTLSIHCIEFAFIRVHPCHPWQTLLPGILRIHLTLPRNGNTIERTGHGVVTEATGNEV